MKTFKIILVSVLGVLDLYFVYATIGYFVLGLQTPKILGDKQTVFMGMFIMSITFFVLFAILTSIIIVLCVKFFRRKKEMK